MGKEIGIGFFNIQQYRENLIQKDGVLLISNQIYLHVEYINFSCLKQ